MKIDELMTMFHKIISAENLKADEEALQLLARAADGSARDGTSLLDQAISLGVGNVKVDVVKNMIGLADRTQNFELFENLVAGNVDKVITLLQVQYKNGANPVTILQDLINITHLVAKTRIIPGSIDDPAVSEEEKDFAKRMSVSVSIAILSKIWQMMIKGINELQIAPLQIDALEMILIRIAYAASLPTPYELLNDVKKNSNLGQERPLPVFARQPQAVNNSSTAKPESTHSNEESSANNGFKTLKTVDDFIRLLEESRKLLVLYAFKNDLSVEHFEDGFMKVTLSEKINPDYILNLHKILEEATGKSWKIEIIKGSLGQTISQKENAKTEEEKRNIMEYPLVKAIMAEFKGAKIETLTRKIMENNDDEGASSFSSEENELNYNDLNFDEE